MPYPFGSYNMNELKATSRSLIPMFIKNGVNLLGSMIEALYEKY